MEAFNSLPPMEIMWSFPVEYDIPGLVYGTSLSFTVERRMNPGEKAWNSSNPMEKLINMRNLSSFQRKKGKKKLLENSLSCA
ncbi:hypothetical protein MUK42_37620 [Musa troglodytarum]|uniref:Uncharacterized protein n=1 Tax=Musa troglodytarum TaxID=320322 RepID=A0A9E7FZF8_9LILI|nr:hypothetical protein MUK42_37620 [Musa troglodytarum]